MSYVWAVINFFNNLMNAIGMLKDAIAAYFEKRRIEKNQERDAAIDKQKNATTEEEFDSQQDKIVDKQP
jgi:hypothetical protein